jgi:hypothetical protein
MKDRIQEVELVGFPTPRDAFAAVLRRDVNMILMPSEGQLELLEGVRGLSVIRGPGLHSVAGLFNSRRVDTGNRRALAHKQLPAEAADAFGSSCRPRTAPRVATDQLDSQPLEIVALEAVTGSRPAALGLRRALGASGGKVSEVTTPEAIRRGLTGDFDILLITLQTWPSEAALSIWVTAAENNFGGYSNPTFDQAFRASDFATAQAELEADPPAIFICDLERTAAVDARILNPQLGDYDMLGNLEDWEVGP